MIKTQNVPRNFDKNRKLAEFHTQTNTGLVWDLVCAWNEKRNNLENGEKQRVSFGEVFIFCVCGYEKYQRKAPRKSRELDGSNLLQVQYQLWVLSDRWDLPSSLFKSPFLLYIYLIFMDK